jgi:hypothetical protein
MYLPYFKGKVMFCNQKVEKLAKSMGFVVGSYITDSSQAKVATTYDEILNQEETLEPT